MVTCSYMATNVSSQSMQHTCQSPFTPSLAKLQHQQSTAQTMLPGPAGHPALAPAAAHYFVSDLY